MNVFPPSAEDATPLILAPNVAKSAPVPSKPTTTEFPHRAEDVVFSENPASTEPLKSSAGLETRMVPPGPKRPVTGIGVCDEGNSACELAVCDGVGEIKPASSAAA